MYFDIFWLLWAVHHSRRQLTLTLWCILLSVNGRWFGDGEEADEKSFVWAALWPQPLLRIVLDFWQSSLSVCPPFGRFDVNPSTLLFHMLIYYLPLTSSPLFSCRWSIRRRLTWATLACINGQRRASLAASIMATELKTGNVKIFFFSQIACKSNSLMPVTVLAFLSRCVTQSKNHSCTYIYRRCTLWLCSITS